MKICFNVYNSSEKIVQDILSVILLIEATSVFLILFSRIPLKGEKFE